MAGGYSSSEITVGAGGARKEIMLFGVRVVLDPMRKSVSLNNLSQYELPEEEIPKIGGEDGDGHDKNKVDATTVGYASADDAAPISSSSGGNRERKRGVPWSEEEHKLFLIGLQKVGKGDWKGISRNFVKSRTSTQVASHAQKYFLRRSNLNRRRRRSSLFDMTTETVIGMSMEEDHMVIQENSSQSPSLVPEIANTFPNQPVIQAFPEFLVPISSGVNNASGNQTQGHVSSSSNLINLVPLTFQSKPSPISLNLSLASSNLNDSSPYKIIPSFNGGDTNNSNMIGVA